MGNCRNICSCNNNCNSGCGIIIGTNGCCNRNCTCSRCGCNPCCCGSNSGVSGGTNTNCTCNCTCNCSGAYRSGYQAGFEAGRNEGYNIGYNAGYQAGYAAGCRNCSSVNVVNGAVAGATNTGSCGCSRPCTSVGGATASTNQCCTTTCVPC
ncbi:MAG: hypothetical protein HFE84_03600 [Lachnospiraceae bacterium]|nr:hypothetical protein [Lachnospiraceae bacterium]